MENFLPKWVVTGIGGLLIVFLALLVIDRGQTLNQRLSGRKPDNTLTVSAEGKVPATPDLATVTVGVISQGTSAKDVKDINNTKVNKIIDFIKEQGVEGKDINTSQFYAYPQYNYNNGNNDITGYQANQTVTIKVRGVDKSQSVVEKILDGVVNVGANEIQGVYFGFEDPDNLRQEARKKAIAKAKEKAQELASEAGLKLGKVVSVSESGGYYPPMPYALDSAMGRGGMAVEKSVAPNIEPGTQDITETMTVVFEVK